MVDAFSNDEQLTRMTTADARYSRTAFIPADQLGFSQVTVYEGDGATVKGTISQAALLARKTDRPARMSPEVIRPKHDPMPSVAALKTLVGPRRRREPQ